MFSFVPCLVAALLFATAPFPSTTIAILFTSLFSPPPLLVHHKQLERVHTALREARVLAAACAALMVACKETAVLHILALAGAACVFWLWNLRGRAFAICGGPEFC